MDTYTKIFILQFCYIWLALSQFPPKYPVAPNPDDPCAKFNGIPLWNLSRSSYDEWVEAGCYNCGLVTGEYIKPGLECDGVEHCSFGRDEIFKNAYECCDPKIVSGQNCAPNGRDCSNNYQCGSGFCKNGKCADPSSVTKEA